jgi:hypothetical protein
MPLKDLLESSGAAQKPKRRGPRETDEDTHPVLERDPASAAEPTAVELAELALAREITPAKAASETAGSAG